MLKKLFGKKKTEKQNYKKNYFTEIYKEDSFLQFLIEKKIPLSNELQSIYGQIECTDEEVLKKSMELNIINEEQLFNHLADYLQVPYFYLEETLYSKDEVELLKKIEKNNIEKYQISLLKLKEKKVKIGISTSFYLEARDFIEDRLPEYKIEIVVITNSLYNKLYNLYQDKLSIVHEIDNIDFNEISENTTENDDLTNEDNPIVKLVNNIFIEAVRLRSSDIHIEPYSFKTLIKNRIDGVLIENNAKIPRDYHESIISRIKIMSKLNIAEQRMPQDGRIKKEINNKIIDFRVSILPTSFGESIVIRILDKKDDVLLLETLGATTEEKDTIIKKSSLPHGMILVTGPTGSGKTTTLYAILNEIQDAEKKVITIEDPVEYQLDNAVQIPVNEKAGLTFAKGLRSILRQDPDKIMVGEIRDRETAEIAMQAALTGHLVITTLHANNTIEAIGRLSNIGVDPFQFATALNLIIGQRLMRKLCSVCQGKGCQDCNNTGYYGRTGVYEIFPLNEEIKEMIIQKESPIKIKEKAIENNMKDLKEKARIKVKNNITTISEYERVIGEWGGGL